MKQMPFERPTDHYDERVFSIDEQICALIKQRKELSNDNPGFPQTEYISKWAEKYELYENMLNSIFGALQTDEHFRPMIEPENFKRYLPVLKSVEKDNVIYTVTFIHEVGLRTFLLKFC